MTPEEVRFLWSLLPGFGVGAVVAAAVAWMLFKHLLPGYLVRKGQNLADKEDIAELTHKVEDVKRQHGEILEAVKYRNQLRMAAIDRRLQVHQEAFAHLRELAKHSHSPEVGKKVVECQEWWEKNCLYLEPAAREAFSNACSIANAYYALLHESHETLEAAKANHENIMSTWNRLVGALSVMLDSVALPPLSEAEKEMLKRDPP